MNLIKKHLPLLKTMARTREILTPWIIFMVVAAAVLITAAVHIVPREQQVLVHYAGFGVTNLYFDSWYYFIVFAAQVVVMLLAHNFITIKLYNLKGKEFAAFFLYFSIALAVIVEFLLLGLFRVVAYLQ